MNSDCRTIVATQLAADALDYAHQRGVVHRDVKPANLLLDAQGQSAASQPRAGKSVAGSSGS